MTNLKIVFSRKGFDSSSGRTPSPIIDGAPISLPIPTGKYPSVSTYGDLNLGDIVSKANKNYAASSFCHEDPMFWDDRCAFGQTSAAQSLLKNNKVGDGDVFLFFGLFAKLGSNDRHHRIFSYLKVEKVLEIGAQPTGREVEGTPRQHPHTIAKWNTDGKKWDCNNTIYLGRGRKAKIAHAALRLTKPGGPTSVWCVPPWLRESKLTYHRDDSWLDDRTLRSASPGQEFVTDVGDLPVPKKWLNKIIAAIETHE
jgi:hypothetical protein